MKELMLAIEILSWYSAMDINNFVKKFEEYSGQVVPKEVVDKFKLTGLNNIDLIRSNFLSDFGLKNIYEI